MPQNPFGTDAMAAGYATSRPAVHPHVVERVRNHLGAARKFVRALDVGCGAGLSTKPLETIAQHCIGVEPVESMLRLARSVAPRAHFLAGRGEALPVRSGSIDLITAAGSLNFADLDLFFPEAARVLTNDGVLIVYDFSQGRKFRDSGSLEKWFEDFRLRYPRPRGEARSISPASLAEMDSGFRVRSHEHFELGLTLSPGFYVDYMMTETNVAYAVRSGTPAEEIRAWCTETLRPVFNMQDHEVLFPGYFACLSAA